MSNATIPPPRGTYRHGDLRHALLEAGIELARAGGPAAVTLREATRRAGVVPNAAYRHFASQQDLLRGVRSAALSALAVSMEMELSMIAAELSPAEFAKASLRAIGTGYLRFARTESGLFRTAFGTGARPAGDVEQASAAALVRSSCWAWRWTGWKRRTYCRRNVVAAPNTWRGRRCMAWRCWSSTARCGRWMTSRSKRLFPGCWRWSRTGFDC